MCVNDEESKQESALSQDFAHRMNAPADHSRHRKRNSYHPVWHDFLSNKKLWLAVSAISIIVVTVLFLPSTNVDASVSLPHEEWLKPELAELQQQSKPNKVVLKPGGSAIAALSNLGLSLVEVIRMSQASKKVYALSKVRAGHAFSRLDEGENTHVFYDVDGQSRLRLSRHDGDWQAFLEPRKVFQRETYVRATISDSLFLSANKAGMDSRTAMNLVDIFAWDIDFARDLRAGDSFQVLYNERYDESGKVIGSRILAAEFINQGQRYSAIRHKLDNGDVNYYSFKGKSLRKTYLKAAVKYSRISSRFKKSRKHPVLGYTRAHKGVDYAARTGTPIHAVGNGRIKFAAWRGGYGRLVEIQHNNRSHRTRYGHLSKFGRGIHKGVRVKQGQIIGYVGMSGLATGPHLHFEFRVRGRAINPLSVKHKPARPVPKVEMVNFQDRAQKLQDVLKLQAQAWTWG
ncbi:MAG: M23 family metallopeptidase [Mariprofundaceae bacterium]